MKKITVLALLITALLASGCVTGRRVVALNIPAGTVVEATKGNIDIVQTIDARKFENKPSSPSTPSVDGDVNAMSKDQLKTMIGRQRNGYGAAMGDIQLAGGSNIEMEAQKLVAEGLKRRGYTTNKAPGNNAVVKVEEFWAWFTPGFAAVTFESRLRCAITLTVNGTKKDLVVNGHGVNKGQVASDANWQLAYSRAFEDFLKNFDSALAGAGL